VQLHGRATAQLPYDLSDGILRYQGTCVVTQASASLYEVACKVGNGDFASNRSGLTLKDLDLGGDRAIALSMCAAHNFTGYLVNETSDETFFHTIDLEFATVDIDINSSLLDSSFTAQYNETIKLTLRYELEIVNALHVYIDIYKNGILIDYPEILETGNSLSIELTLAVGDVISLKCTAQSEIGPHEDYRVDYSFGNLILECISKINAFTSNSDYAVFPVHNPDILANFPDDAFVLDNISIKTLYSQYFKVANYYRNGEFPIMMYGNFEGVRFICANLFIPFVFLSKILTQIATEAGFSIVNNPFENTEFEGAVIFNAYCENNYASSNLSLTPVKSTFNLSDHVPEMGQNDFLKYISTLTGYMPIIDNNQLTITFVDLKDKHILSETNPAIPFPGILLTDGIVKVDPEYNGIKLELTKAGADAYLNNIKPLTEKLVYKGDVEFPDDPPTSGNQVNDMYLIWTLNEYHVFQYNPDTYSLNWGFYSKNFQLVYTEGQEPFLTVTSGLCPVLTSLMTDDTPGAPANRQWIIPHTLQAGILEGFPDSLSAEYGLQVLYYKGMSNDSLNQPYPLGTSRMADYTGDLDFFPDLSADSLFENRYKGFLRWLAYETKPATLRAILTRAQLKALRFDQIYSGTGFNFLVKEIRVNLSADGLSLAEIDIYTC
jgi:hypothetical protein